MSKAVKIFFVGDLRIEDTNKSWMGSELQTLVRSCDWASCNFEAPVVDRKSIKGIQKIGPLLSQTKKAADLVKTSGFNLINLSNNHIADYGLEGIKTTLESFSSETTLGVGRDFQEAYRLKILTKHDLKIGCLSFSEWGFGACVAAADHGFAWINHPDVNRFIVEAKKSVDFLILQVHAGVEELRLPLPEWRERYHELLSLGADAIVAHHPHIPQGWERVGDKLIFYSLGNFYMDPFFNHPDWNRSFGVSLQFLKGSPLDYEIVPIERRGGTVEVHKDLAFMKDLESLCEDLKEPGYSHAMNAHIERLWRDRYKDYYFAVMDQKTGPITLKKWLKFNFRWLRRKEAAFNSLFFQHNFKIESHRWAIDRALNLPHIS